MVRQSIFIGIAILIISVTYVTANYQPFPIKENREDLSAYPKNISYRLPNESLPLSYDISLTWTDEVSFSFTGRSVIQIIVVEPTSVIVVHSKLANFTNVTLISQEAGGKIMPTTWTYSNVTDFLSVIFNGTMYPGYYTLDISYSSTLRTSLSGFFRQSYVNSNNERRWLATTHFEPSNARHAFPCYDEPQIKANFSISLTHKSEYYAVSNMREISKTNSSGLATTTFAPTPPTSSYLIAFAISDYALREGRSNSSDPYSQTLVRVLTRPSWIQNAKLALDSGISIIAEIGRHVGVPFTLDKIDQIAVPGFGGAMENWGLVVYGEGQFFWDGTGSYRLREGILTIIAHEFGHQWFGNLVGPDWWEYIWLNEGFANYYGYKGVDLVHPEMGMMDLYLVENVQSIFNTDGNANIRPMSHYVEDPQSISWLFDSIAYGKSGSVIRMFFHAFTEQTFAKGLNKYLNARSLAAATEDDLFASIAAAVKEDNRLSANYSVPDIMRSWTRQSGFPLLNVTRDYRNGNIILSQTRYFNDPNLHGTSNSTWWIPYNFITGNKTNANLPETVAEGWLNSSISLVSQSNSSQWSSNDWVFFNKNATGYYRVMYDKQNYDLLATALKNGKAEQIDSLGRSQLLDDAYNYLQTKRWNNYGDILNLMQFLKNDPSFAPWMIGLRVLENLKQRIAGTEQWNRFEKFQRNLVETLYKSVGIDDLEVENTYLNKYTRVAAIEMACSSGLKACRSETTAKLKSILDNKQEFHQNVRRSMYCESIRGAKRDDFNRVWIKLADFNNTDNQYRNILIRGLSCVDDKKLLNEYLNSALNSTNDKLIVYRSVIEQQQVLTSVYQNSLNGLKMVIKYLIKNLDEAYRTYAPNGLSTILSGISSRITNKSDRKEFEKLAKLCKQKNYVSQANLEYFTRLINQNFQWNDQYLKGINDWLKHNV